MLCFYLFLPTEQINYRIYLRISRKIYDKIMPQKLGGDLSAGDKARFYGHLTTAVHPPRRPPLPLPATMVPIVVQWPS